MASNTSKSEYYNTRGDTAKQYQTYLNTQGANLAVDGIWGAKTEAAYQANKDAFEQWRAGNSTTSQYYGQRGDATKDAQTYLNTQGSNLAVDGIWGPKTEAAYQANKDAYNAWAGNGSASTGSASGTTGSTSTGSTSTGSSTGSTNTTTAGVGSDDLATLLSQYQSPTYTSKSDDQLRAEAEAQYSSTYNAQKLAAEQKNQAYQQSITQQIEGLRQQLAESQAETQQQYQLNGNQLQRMLTARGMGRSTYAGDVAQNNLNAMATALNKLLTNYNTEENSLRQQGALYAQQTADTLAQLLADRETNVQNAYNTLKNQEYDRQVAAQNSYNQLVSNLQQMLSDRNLTQQQLEETIRQFDESQDLTKQQLAESIRQFNEQQKLAYAQI